MWDTGWAQSPLMFNVINSKPPLVKCHNTFRWKHLEHRRTTKRGSKWRKIVFHETKGENEEKRFKWKHPPFLSEHSETSSNTYTRHKSPPQKDILTSWAEQGHNRDAKQAGGWDKRWLYEDLWARAAECLLLYYWASVKPATEAPLGCTKCLTLGGVDRGAMGCSIRMRIERRVWGRAAGFHSAAGGL